MSEYENSERGDGAYLLAEPEKVEETTAKAVHIVSDVTSKVSSKIGRVNIFKNPREYFKPILNGVQYIWIHFPPASWFAYGVLILNAIPASIFLGFILFTMTLILSIVAVGVLFAEGFLFGIGLVFFVPVFIIMCFAALSTAFFTTFVYCGYRIICYILRNLGILAEEAASDVTAAAKGIKKGWEEERYGRERSQ
ncbi:hypothetical protein F8M41_003625 [Gigaspora margarita]|uniref:Uncharacterized protein n=1 Tax=Gigaspora margarita TaxID=4874 RepID=A0A8H4A8C2_GIGMA|nr:hypothetical protein F8M41_003625 [Gigaspora margarita]